MAGVLFSSGTLSGCVPSKPVSNWLEETLVKLRSLRQQPLTFDGPWQAFATFSHLAQSIEFSLTGFPEHKSDSFKTWAGKPAFTVFKAVGGMQHNTAEPIPGAMPLNHAMTDIEQVDISIDRVINALHAFTMESELFPHFAYGELSHSDYLVAHLLHIEDHLNLLITR